jgi:CcmD family protein
MLARIAVIVGLYALPWAVLSAAPASAQDETVGDRATSFQAVQGAAKEDVPGGPLLVAAYAFVLVLVIGYAARLGALQAKTARELERLTRSLEARGKRE